MNLPDSLSLFSLQNKTAVITGGTGVLGQSMVKAISSAGANVAVLGRRKEAGDALVAELIAAGGKAISVNADVLERDQLEAAKATVLKQFGAIDILINAAGGNMPGAVVAPEKTFFDMQIGDFQKVVDLNLLGSVLPTQVFSEDMARRKKGVIINIASMAAMVTITRVAGYSAAKAAITNFTSWLAVEMAHKYGEGIRVNAISPGFFLTEQNRSLLTNPDGSYTARGQKVISQTPYGRFGRPEELSGTLVWLCSDASAFVTGINVPVDGGFNVFSGV
ncbi:MAG TPA: SDR family oxidoreductase [Cyclobacteriaceae bacterium]|nr:SDR family oxidoreductase [Cyclobacteriaceae bacterium]